MGHRGAAEPRSHARTARKRGNATVAPPSGPSSRRRPRRGLTGAATFLALFLLSAPTLAVAGSEDSRLGFGIGQGGVAAMTDLRLPPDHVQTWAGPWNTRFLGLADELADAEARDATLVVEWYYWGDLLHPDCWQTGCEGRTLEAWKTKTAAMADVIAASGTSPIVVVESEFNKNDIADPGHAAAFDAALAEVERILHERAPAAQVALGYGAWRFDQWQGFPLALAEADLVGIQAMASVGRQGTDGVVGLAEKTLAYAAEANATFGKPVIVHDIAIASHPQPDAYLPQAQGLQGFIDRADAFADAGVVALVYRGYRDAPQAGHFGEAEGTFGLTMADGTAKPSWGTWISGIATHRAER